MCEVDDGVLTSFTSELCCELGRRDSGRRRLLRGSAAGPGCVAVGRGSSAAVLIYLKLNSCGKSGRRRRYRVPAFNYSIDGDGYHNRKALPAYN